MKRKKPDFPHIEAVCAEITACSNRKINSPCGIEGVIDDYHAFPVVGQSHPQLKDFTIKELSTLVAKEHLKKLDCVLTIFSLAKENVLFSKESKLHLTMLNNDIVPTARIVRNKVGHQMHFSFLLLVGFINLKTNDFYTMLNIQILPGSGELIYKIDNYCFTNFTPEITQIINNLELNNLKIIYQAWKDYFGNIQKNLINGKSIDEVFAEIKKRQEGDDIAELFSAIAQWNESGVILSDGQFSPSIYHHVYNFVTNDFNQHKSNEGFISLHDPKVTIISENDDEKIIDVSLWLKPNNSKLLPYLLEHGKRRQKNINDDLFQQFKTAIIADKQLSDLFAVPEKQVGVRITLTKVTESNGVESVLSKVTPFDGSERLLKYTCSSIIQSALFNMTQYENIKLMSLKQLPQNFPVSRKQWECVQKINQMYSECDEQLFSLLNDDNATIHDVANILTDIHVLNDMGVFNYQSQVILEHKGNYVPVTAISTDILSKPGSWKQYDCSFNWDFIFEYGNQNTKHLVILLQIGKMNNDLKNAFNLDLMLRLYH